MSERTELLATSPLSLDQIFEGAPDPIVVVDDGGIVVTANARVSEVFGYELSDLIGSTIETLVPREIREEHVQMRRRYMEEPTVRPMGVGLGLHAVHRDGSSIPVEICLSPCVSGGRAYVIGTIRDVTRMRQMEQELQARTEALEESNRELEQFAYVASHDLQEPLRHITGFCQILQDDHAASLDADGDHCLNVVIEATARMRDLINDLLDYSRVGRLERPSEDIEVQQVIDVVLSNLDQAIEESGAEVVVGSMPEVHADSFHLISVFQNLIGNAIKFRREGVAPRVDVDARREGDAAWRFTIRDNGIGIEPEHRDRIFEIFKKLHARQRFEGTGIGLSIVRKVVEQLGGRIEVESTPGAGTTFSFVLPGGKQNRQGE